MEKGLTMRVSLILVFFVVMIGGCLCENNSVLPEEIETKLTDVDYEMKIGKLFYGILDVSKPFLNFFMHDLTMENSKILASLADKYEMNTTQKIYEVFSPFDEYYKSKANEIYGILMNCKDVPTFYKNAALIRSFDYVQEEVLLYALYAAVSHSNITGHVKIPPPYIANPYLFYPAEAIERARDEEYNTSHKLRKPLNPVISDLDYLSLNSYHGLNRDAALDYFREDLDLNSYYYFNALEDAYLQEQCHDNDNRELCRNGEQYYYFHRQLLIRYKLEMMANEVQVQFHDLERIHEYIQYGFQPKMKYKSGAVFPKRTFNFNVSDEFENGNLNILLNFATGIQQSLDDGYVTMSSGELKSLKKPEDLEFLARLIRANVDATPYSSKIRRYLGSSDDEKNRVTPSALEQLETTLRDPLFWSLCNQLVGYFTTFKNKLPAYTNEELDFQGVSITDLFIDEPVNMFDGRYTSDITSAMHKEIVNTRSITLALTTKRTTISYFNIVIKLQSEIAENATVRLFISPQINDSNIYEKRDLFWEIDAFTHSLEEGVNVITRKSDQFRHSQPAYDWMSKGSERKRDERKVGGFPSGLYLPRGKNGETIPLYLHAIVTKYDPSDECRMRNCKRSENKFIVDSSYFIDGKAFGFPFDRRLPDDSLTVTNYKFSEWTYKYNLS